MYSFKKLNIPANSFMKPIQNINFIKNGYVYKQGVSERLISLETHKVLQKKLKSFHNLITWSIFVQIISTFNNMCENNSKFYVWFYKVFQILKNVIHRKRRLTIKVVIFSHKPLRVEIISKRIDDVIENSQIIPIFSRIFNRISATLFVVYWPPTQPKMPFQRRMKCLFHWRGRAWLTIWDRFKIPRYSHRLMHQKGVTCELHDSYFRSMTTKHAILKTSEVHIPVASYGKILSGRLNSVKTGSQLVWRPNQLVTRCDRESQHPAELGPRASGWAAQENGKETLVSPTPSHTQPFQIKWEVHIFLKDCVVRYHCVVVMISHAYVFVWLLITIQHFGLELFVREEIFIQLSHITKFG